MWVVGSNLGPQNSSSNLLRSALRSITSKMNRKAADPGAKDGYCFGHRTDR